MTFTDKVSIVTSNSDKKVFSMNKAFLKIYQRVINLCLFLYTWEIRNYAKVSLHLIDITSL